MHVQLTSASVIATRLCNARCRACGYAGGMDRTRIDPGAFRALLPVLERGGVRRVTWTGGEPTLHPRLPELMRDSHLAGMSNVLITNGSTFADTFPAFAPWVDQIILSLDAPDAETYRDIRGLDGFERLRDIPRLVKQHDPTIGVAVCLLLQRLNIDHIERFVSMAAVLPLDRIAFLPLDLAGFVEPEKRGNSFGRRPVAGAAALDDVLPSLEQLDRFTDAIPRLRARLAETPGLSATTLEYLDRYVDYYRRFIEGRTIEANPPCGLPWSHVVITPEMGLKPCFFVPETLPGDGENPLFSDEFAQLRCRLLADDATRERSCRWCLQTARSYS